jgi:hypothetical protein
MHPTKNATQAAGKSDRGAVSVGQPLRHGCRILYRGFEIEPQRRLGHVSSRPVQPLHVMVHSRPTELSEP